MWIHSSKKTLVGFTTNVSTPEKYIMIEVSNQIGALVYFSGPEI
jgi:hypothetical protein